MSWFSWLSSSPKVVNDVFDKDSGLISQAGAWIGNQNLTDEEVLEANAKTVELVQQYAIRTLDENSERSKSRREIAFLIIQAYLLWFSVACGMWPIVPEWSVFIIGALSGVAIGGAFTAVVVFFFGSHGLARHNETKAKK